MSERPILFSGPMVRAILEGRKTQTRRVVKPQPAYIESSGRWCWPLPKRARFPGCCTEVVTASREWWEYAPAEAWAYRPGDTLWVRETWARNRVLPIEHRPPGGVIYKADERWAADWSPSIHMPRWASRLTLRVTDVRVQRVQEISEKDSEAEGIEPYPIDRPIACNKEPGFVRYRFSELWDSINAKRGYSWESNPWVWAVSFERVKR